MTEQSLDKKIHCAEHCDSGRHESCIRESDVKQAIQKTLKELKEYFILDETTEKDINKIFKKYLGSLAE